MDADGDLCHVRDRHTADPQGHGKNYFLGKEDEKRKRCSLTQGRSGSRWKNMPAPFSGWPALFMICRYAGKDSAPRDTERMLRETEETVCSRCAGREECWRRKRCRSRELGENLIRAMEMAEPEVITAAQGDWFDMCRNGARFLEELKHIFVRERQNLIWNNRLIEGRLAVAEQLGKFPGSCSRWPMTFTILRWLRQSRRSRYGKCWPENRCW